MTGGIRVVVVTTRSWLVEIDPDEYSEPADITAERLAERLNDCPDSYEHIPGSHASEGEIDADYQWRAPHEWEVTP